MMKDVPRRELACEFESYAKKGFSSPKGSEY